MEWRKISIRDHKGKIAFIVLAAVLLVGYFIVSKPLTYHQYHRDITRKVDNDFEETLLEMSETLDYPSILGFEDEWGEGELNPKEEIYTQYISKDFIQYYWDRLGHLKSRLSRGYCYMYYGADVHYVDNLSAVVYEKDSEHSEYKYAITLEPLISTLYPDIDIPAYGMASSVSHSWVAFWNGKDFDILEGIVIGEDDNILLERDFTDCILVEMVLHYGRQTFVLSGSGFVLFQDVVFDQNGDILMISIWRIDWES
ncbi:MAG: hypothetical protein HXS52_05735 [Theionarchaea archaeon]|nr:hypothetical protein [Theionarchaea archaeon]